MGLEIVHYLDQWGRVAAKLGPGRDWHEPDNYGLTGRFDGTDGDLDNAGLWPMDVSRAETGYSLGYDHSPEGAPRRGEMAIIISSDAWENGRRYRGRDRAAVNVADLLGWAAEAAYLQEKALRLEREARELRKSIAELKAAARGETSETA